MTILLSYVILLTPVNGNKNKHNSLKKLLELQPSEKTRREHPCRHSVILVVKPVGAPRKNFQGRCCHLKYFWCFYWLYVHTVLYGRVPRETACPVSRVSFNFTKLFQAVNRANEFSLVLLLWK